MRPGPTKSTPKPPRNKTSHNNAAQDDEKTSGEQDRLRIRTLPTIASPRAVDLFWCSFMDRTRIFLKCLHRVVLRTQLATVARESCHHGAKAARPPAANGHNDEGRRSLPNVGTARRRILEPILRCSTDAKTEEGPAWEPDIGAGSGGRSKSSGSRARKIRRFSDSGARPARLFAAEKTTSRIALWLVTQSLPANTRKRMSPLVSTFSTQNSGGVLSSDWDAQTASVADSEQREVKRDMPVQRVGEGGKPVPSPKKEVETTVDNPVTIVARGAPKRLSRAGVPW